MVNLRKRRPGFQVMVNGNELVLNLYGQLQPTNKWAYLIYTHENDLLLNGKALITLAKNRFWFTAKKAVALYQQAYKVRIQMFLVAQIVQLSQRHLV